MPLPFVLGFGAAVAGVTGVTKGIQGALKVNSANKTMKTAQEVHNQNLEKFENVSQSTYKKMDDLGKLELRILNQFEKFSDIIEKIQNRPQFQSFEREKCKLPSYDKEDLKKVSVGAGVLLGGLSGAVLGTAGGFAAAGATTSAVMALGTASTGTAISSLSGIAATNATLAALGGGSLAVGGGGMALGTTILGAASLGIGLLVGGILFDVTGKKLSENANEAYDQMKKAENQINTICKYLNELDKVAKEYIASLKSVYKRYLNYYSRLSYIVNEDNKVDWNNFNEEERLVTQNTILLVQLLYEMCQVKLVKKSEGNEINEINTEDISETMDNVKEVMGYIEK